MANTFGVTDTLLQRTHFAQAGAFTSYSTPSDEVVAAVIQRKSARLAAKLLKEGIDATSITDEDSNAYLLGQEIVLLESAVEVMEMMTGQTPEIVRLQEQKLKGIYDELEEEGWLAMGAPDTDATPLVSGPHSHLDSGIETEDLADVSSVLHKLRARDQL